jgi:hypothetical protein
LKHFWDLVEGYYTKPFMDLLMEPRPRFRLPDAVLAFLAGELEGGWKLLWRRRLFLFLTRVQGFWQLVPKISFEEPHTHEPTADCGPSADKAAARWS